MQIFSDLKNLLTRALESSLKLANSIMDDLTTFQQIIPQIFRPQGLNDALMRLAPINPSLLVPETHKKFKILWKWEELKDLNLCMDTGWWNGP